MRDIHHYDIVCFQEAWGFFQEIKQLIVALAQKAGFLYYAETKDPSFASTYIGDAGILILSRFPVTSSHYMPYSYGIYNDGFTRRGVLYAEITVNTDVPVKLHIFNTHMQSSYFHPPHEAPDILKRAL